MVYTSETVDLHEVVQESLALCDPEARSGRDIRLMLRAEAHHVQGDPRLRQVVWNLVHNALRNTPADGSIRLATHDRPPRSIVLSVTDNGRGIEPAVLPRIFNVFEQDEEARRRGVGLGLGLPISKSIVEAHGGRLTASSAGRGLGARFTVELLTVPAPAPHRPVEIPPRPLQRPRNVLLVEDNADSATALAMILEMHGYGVTVAATVQEALEQVEGADILISDIGLPDGTGYDLMRAVAARRPIPAIALSGYGSSEDQRRSAEAGFELHIVKPVEADRLLDALQSLSAKCADRDLRAMPVG
jgi:CheY-like chemotaxis protein